ncbi:thiopurine S-methyltransferase [Phytopseudomonas punonensis]|uniref:Thiopurine S-methyltransferase n=1 Tax=Phytopseudomonas punonensis TaxID=1220495 RepID=A0A1M7E418_9GAMM|nr:thiopurine S-methyltransferase [Pseudomonas punonensis]SHL86501.1 thiopurine S-methyltransferase [Pseudomonas punonensis]
MRESFWLQRWQANQIGFHAKQVNPLLQRHWPALACGPESAVLIPLCGKSLDIAWLASRGHKVIGVELAEVAVAAFFAEQGVRPLITEEGAFKVYRHERVKLLCGDFFALEARHLQDCTLFYDRAALIALPAEMRERYVGHLHSVLPSGSKGLLVTLDYDQALMDGPPFSVSDAEVQGWSGKVWSCELLETQGALERRFEARGLTRMDERAYRVQLL